MKIPLHRLAICIFILAVMRSSAATLYADLNSANPLPPYADWSTAATNIQDAIEASSDGDQIWVTNGIYQTGGIAMVGNLTNRVALHKAVTVQSVNGPFVTVIQGAGAANGTSAIRCAWLTNSAALVGFTLRGGATRTSGATATLQSGGAAWCASSNAVIIGCIIVSNSASFQGAAVYQGSLDTCDVSRNSCTTPLSGAIFSAVVNDCTVISNSAAGTSGGNITNSIVYYNIFGNYNGGLFSYCCVAPAAAGTGNFTNAPQLLPDGFHLSGTSPCIGAGTIPATTSDIFGNSWASPPSVGCFEAASKPVVTQPQIQVTGAPVGVTVGNAMLSGQGPFTFQWLKDGATLQDNGHFSSTASSNLVVSGPLFADAGAYQLIVSNNFGAVTSAVAQVVIHCVDASGANPVSPYTNWMNAATQIQDAIDAAGPDDVVLVTNGVYNTGGEVMSEDLTNRVALSKPLAVIGVNGYAVTAIEGQWDSGSTNGPGAIRCAWLTNGAVLSGFTLRNGATRGGLIFTDAQYGGGAWLSTNAIVSNCAFTNNSADNGGGGVAFGTVNNSFLTQNTVQYGFSGGGGGGAYQASLNNCTIVQNYVLNGGGVAAGVQSCSARNCIVLYNYFSSFGIPNFSEANYSTGSFVYSCTHPIPIGAGNIYTNVEFIDGTFHLPSVSPCRGAGSSLYATGTDLDDEPWANPPSMGCDEIINSNLVGSLAVAIIRLQTGDALVNDYYGMQGVVTGRASSLSWSFGDGTIITNAGSGFSHIWTNPGSYTITFTAYNFDNPSGVSTNTVLEVDPVISPVLGSAGIVSNSLQFAFPTQTNALYTLQYATNLTEPVSWQSLQSLLGNGGIMTFQDPLGTDAIRFYRIQAH